MVTAGWNQLAVAAVWWACYGDAAEECGISAEMIVGLSEAEEMGLVEEVFLGFQKTTMAGSGVVNFENY